MGLIGRELRSTLNDDSTLTLSLEMVEIPDPGDDEIVVRVEAAPVNPSDIGLLIGPADLSSLRQGGTVGSPSVDFDVAPARLAASRSRIGRSLPIGNEGAGTVVAAGTKVSGLVGRRVGMFGGAMYADYRRIVAKDVTPLPEGASVAEGAAMFVNPLTALGFVETARNEGHKAIVHTAAASNLGQMLQKICLADDIPLINIVRSQQQVDILAKIGAQYVLNSKDEDFVARLTDLLEETGATIAFDPIGGGMLGSEILWAMEQAASRHMEEFTRYGSNVFKQLYVYGVLDPSPIVLNRLSFGFNWSAGGWLLGNFLRKAGQQTERRMRQRVVDELTSTFASSYTRTVGLAQALESDVIRAFGRQATGEKILIDPTRG